MEEMFITEEEKNKIMLIINHYSSPLSDCSAVSKEFADGYNYAFSRLKEKINNITGVRYREADL